MTTNITISKLKTMSHKQLVFQGQMFPFICQWENKDALFWFIKYMNKKA